MNYKILVNMFGAPGVGKTTGVGYVFSKLKIEHYYAEMILESFKDLAYVENDIHNIDFPRHAIYTKKRIENVFRGAESIVLLTDTPMKLGKVYRATYEALELSPDVVVLDIFVHRTKPYFQQGRWHTEAESIEASKKLLEIFDYDLEIEGNLHGYETLLKFIKQKIKSLTRVKKCAKV